MLISCLYTLVNTHSHLLTCTVIQREAHMRDSHTSIWKIYALGIYSKVEYVISELPVGNF